MGDSLVILYKCADSPRGFIWCVTAFCTDYEVCPFNVFQLSLQLSSPCLSNSKADLEGLIKEFSSLITAHLNSSCSYFSSSPSFASHFVKSSLKAPGWLGFWWGTEGFFMLILIYPKEEQRIFSLRSLGPAAWWHRLKASQEQLPRLKCLIRVSHTAASPF